MAHLWYRAGHGRGVFWLVACRAGRGETGVLERSEVWFLVFSKQRACKESGREARYDVDGAAVDKGKVETATGMGMVTVMVAQQDRRSQVVVVGNR